MWGTRSSRRKEAIPHFFLISTIFKVYPPNFQGHFLNIDIFWRTAREIGMKTSHNGCLNPSACLLTIFLAIEELPLLLVGFACPQLYEALEIITPLDAMGYYIHAGYF